MKGGLLLDIVITQGTSIFKLLSCKDQSLLLRWDSFLVLNFGLYVGNGVIWLNVQGNGFTSQSLDEDLHGTTTKTKDKMKSRLLLDVIITQGTSIFKLLSCKDQSLLLRWNS